MLVNFLSLLTRTLNWLYTKTIKSVKRFRPVALMVMSGLAIALTLHYDPTGDSLKQAGTDIAQLFWALVFTHIARKIMFDYPEADWRSHFRSALQEKNTASGIVCLAQAIIFIGLVFLFSSRAMA